METSSDSVVPNGEGLAASGINPFQVYPVRALHELQDVRIATVETLETRLVRDAVREFARGFTGDTADNLLLAARGDFGTGKTHLMLYARDVLGAEIEALRNDSKTAANAPGEPVAAIAVSIEAPIEDWYSDELAPGLFDNTPPRALARDLFTEIACALAEADPDPEIKQLALTFRESRRALYDNFRQPGEFDIAEVRKQFNAAVKEACPHTSHGFRHAVEALLWEETADLAEDWLAGNPLSEADAARIGVRSGGGDRASRGASAICLIASLSRKLGRPFLLFIDEFEHLTRFDLHNGSKRNITWTKRLVESLARRGAMVFIAGHWEAWKQQGDFLDRFVGGRPIQLVRLTDDDVAKVVEVRAGHWPVFTSGTAQAVVDETSGNIRQVMTVLYDLWDEKARQTREATTPEKLDEARRPITPEMVQLAAQRRMQPGSDMAILPAIERAVQVHGGVLRRGQSFGKDRAVVDGAVWLAGQLRVLVEIVHAHDELALVSAGENFAKLVQAERQGNPGVCGLCVTFGAVVAKHLLTLDAAFPETELVNGEEPDLIERLPQIVQRALAPREAGRAPLPAPAAALEALEQTRIGIVSRAEEQLERSKEVFGNDSRSQAVRESSVANADELAGQREKARNKVAEELLLPSHTLQFTASLLRNTGWLGSAAAGVLLALVIAGFRPLVRAYLLPADSYLKEGINYLPPGWEIIYLALWLFFLFHVGFSGYLAMRLWVDVRQFNLFRNGYISRIFDSGASVLELRQAAEILDDALAFYGPREGRRRAMERFEKETSTRMPKARKAASEFA